MKIKISRHARAHLRRIHARSVTHWGAARAERTILEIEAAWLRLARFPQLARPLAGHPGLIRIEAHPHVVIAKRVGRTLHIAAILHGSMDPDRWSV